MMRWLRGATGRARTAPEGVDDRIVDELRSSDPVVRAGSARACGLCALEPAVPLLVERLADSQPRVRLAAARALGRIGGARSADALMRALRARRISAGRTAMELARAAPDHYLAAEIERPENHDLRLPLVLAAALRRGPFPSAILFGLMKAGEAERAGACHAFAALGHTEAAPLLIDELFDQSPRVRRAARSALNRLGAREPVPGVPEPTAARHAERSSAKGVGTRRARL